MNDWLQKKNINRYTTNFPSAISYKITSIFLYIYINNMFSVFIYVSYMHMCFLYSYMFHTCICVSCIHICFLPSYILFPEFIWILCFVCLIWDFLFLMANPTDFPVQLQQIYAVCILAFPVPVWQAFLLHIRVL